MQSPANEQLLIQSLRSTRMHLDLQRAEAGQGPEVDHLQDLGRLEADRGRGDVVTGRLHRVSGEAAEREVEGPEGQGGHGRQVCGV